MKTGFTLIELLVVVTIMVILLALLTPTMEEAIYQAELTVCGATQKGVGGAVVSGAIDHQRAYPDRPAALQPNHIAAGSAAADYRPQLSQYMPSLNEMLNDPFVIPVDLKGQAQTSNVFSSYTLWFGWHFDGAEGGPGMKRVGERWKSRGKRYGTLLQDRDVENTINLIENAGHPDRDNILAPTSQEGAITESRFRGPSHARGPIDLNITSEDLAVVRYNRIEKFDSLFGPPPEGFDFVRYRRAGDESFTIVPK